MERHWFLFGELDLLPPSSLSSSELEDCLRKAIMPLTLPLSLEVGSKLEFLLLLPRSTLAELEEKSSSCGERMGTLWPDSNPHIRPHRMF